ncbi:MAG TPA: hypothetical protein VIG87_06455, partial [Candidatus Udaeobacter sp.]
MAGSALASESKNGPQGRGYNYPRGLTPMVLAKPSLRRLLLEKPRAKSVPARLPVRTLVMIV